MVPETKCQEDLNVTLFRKNRIREKYIEIGLDVNEENKINNYLVFQIFVFSAEQIVYGNCRKYMSEFLVSNKNTAMPW